MHAAPKRGGGTPTMTPANTRWGDMNDLMETLIYSPTADFGMAKGLQK